MRGIAKLALFACALLGGGPELAAESGDFGRPRESVFVDEFLPWLKDGFDGLTGQRVATAPYTDDERTLRDLAYAILLPPEAEGPSRLTLAGIDFVELWNRWVVAPQPFDVRSYSEYLISTPYRSSTARYARLIDDIRADIGRVPPFFSMANRVVAADAIRARSFQFISLTREKLDLARARIAENRGFIDRVYDRFRERIAGYRYALEALMVLTPSPNAVEAERALFVLEDRLKRMTSPPPPVVAGGVISK